MSRVLIPRSSTCSAKVVSSVDFEKYFCDLIDNYVICGMAIAAGCGLAVSVASGNARVLGLHLENSTSCTVMCLTACSCNNIFMRVDRDCCSRPKAWSFTTNTTGCPITDAMLIGVATTNMCSVTAVDNTVKDTFPFPFCQAYPHSTTICDYTTPCNVIAKSCCSTFSDRFCTYSTQCAADTAWPTTDTTNLRVNISNDNIDFDSETGACAATDNVIVHDLGACCTVSDSAWVLDFELIFTTQGVANPSAAVYFGISSNNQCNDATASQDFIGWQRVFLVTTSSRKWLSNDSNGAALPGHGGGDSGTCETLANCTTFYFRIRRLTTTTYEAIRFTDAGRSCAAVTLAGTVSACTTGLRFIKFITSGAPCGARMIGTVDNVILYDGITCPDCVGKAIDNNNCTQWISTSQTNPAIIVDMGAAKDMSAMVIRKDVATTSTEIKIRVSTDTTFTDSENVRVVKTACLTAGTDKFIRFNRLTEDRRFLQVIGTDTDARVLAIDEMKVRIPTDFTRRHEHKKISTFKTGTDLSG